MVQKSIAELFIDCNETGFHVVNQNSYTSAYCNSFHQHSEAEKIDPMTHFIFNLLMMENALIKSPCMAKKLWELIYEIKSLCLLSVDTLSYWKSS